MYNVWEYLLIFVIQSKGKSIEAGELKYYVKNDAIEDFIVWI